MGLEELVDREFSEITIKLTNDCNLNCSFCINKENLFNLELSDPEKLLEAIRIIKHNQCPEWTILGGEPLLEKELFFKVVELLMEDGYHRGIHLMTNGILLDEEIFEFCEERGVFFNISNSGSSCSEKSIQLLLDNPSIKKRIGIENGMIGMTLVVDPLDNFAKKAIMLHRCFGWRISISMDQNKMAGISDEEVDSYLRNCDEVYEYCKKFITIDKYNTKMVLIIRFGGVWCDGKGLFFQANGTYEICSDKLKKRDIPHESGCLETVEKVGDENYRKIVASVSKLRGLWKNPVDEEVEDNE